MKKAPEAFRTISEVAEILDTPAHVLRFWESKFYQIRPVKRAGGRRYYRPDDVALINGIKTLLQAQGMTIRGVQRVLQEQGAKHVAGLGGDIMVADDGALEGRFIDPQELPAGGLGDPPDEPVRERALAYRTPPRSLPIPVEAPVDAAAKEPADDSVDSDEGPIAPADAEPPPLTAQAAAVEIVAVEEEERVEPGEPDNRVEPEPSEEPVDAAVAETVDGPTEEPVTELAAEPVTDPDVVPDAEPVALAAEETGAVSDEPVTEPEPEPEPAPAPAVTATPAPEVFEPSERAQIARRLRTMPRAALGARRGRAELLARRIDALLERMSEASGAGRW